MKKLLLGAVALSIQSWTMEFNENRLSTPTHAQAVIEIDSDSESSNEEITTTQSYSIQQTSNNNNHARSVNLPVINSRIARIQREEFPRVRSRAAAVPTSSRTLPSNVSTYAKQIVDQKVACIDCCGLSLGNWARGLSHVALAHKRAQTIFACSKCNTLFDSAQNALACITKHDDTAIFTCPNCMVDCVVYEAFLKHMCPVIKTEIKSELIDATIDQSTYTTRVMPQVVYSDSVEPSSVHSEPFNPVSALLLIPQTPESGYINTPITDASSVESEMVASHDITDRSQKKSHQFDPKKALQKNVKILRKMIKKRINEKKYQCCSEKDLSWESFCNHVRVTHEVDKNIILCPVCSKEFNGYLRGYDHIAWHTHRSLFSCPLLCSSAKSVLMADDDQRKSRDHLVSHFKKCFKKKYNVSPAEELMCNYCSKNFANTGNLNRHITTCAKKSHEAERKLNSSESENEPAECEYNSDNNPEIHPTTASMQTTGNSVVEQPQMQDFMTDLPQSAPMQKTRARQQVITPKPQQPVVVENCVFDAAGDWESNRMVLNKLISARFAKLLFTCCDLSNLSWQAFCDHQKEQHRTIVDGKDKVVCPVCDESHRYSSATHVHTATHQYPNLFNCPLCTQNYKSSYKDVKDNFMKHFKKCFTEKYHSAQNNNQIANVENQNIEDISAASERSSQQVYTWIDESLKEFHTHAKS